MCSACSGDYENPEDQEDVEMVGVNGQVTVIKQQEVEQVSKDYHEIVVQVTREEAHKAGWTNGFVCGGLFVMVIAILCWLAVQAWSAGI